MKPYDTRWRKEGPSIPRALQVVRGAQLRNRGNHKADPLHVTFAFNTKGEEGAPYQEVVSELSELNAS